MLGGSLSGLKEFRPARHQIAALVEEVGSPIGSFDLIAQLVRNALSATSFGKSVFSAAQSVKDDRKP
ncbi:MAG: hypothetical protein LKM31_09625 [Sphingobium sp.]|jgi:hypothetical protein|nr:hypothetical protein [Sphingobium sp.]